MNPSYATKQSYVMQSTIAILAGETDNSCGANFYGETTSSFHPPLAGETDTPKILLEWGEEETTIVDNNKSPTDLRLDFL